MLAQQHRLRRHEEVSRIRKEGTSYRHPLFILLVKPAADPPSRFAFVASRRVGNAVARNRAKRLLREAVRSALGSVDNGWDCVLIARQPLKDAEFDGVKTAVFKLFNRAGLIQKPSC